MIAVAYDTVEDIQVISKYNLSKYHLYFTLNYLGPTKDFYFLHEGYCSLNILINKELELI